MNIYIILSLIFLIGQGLLLGCNEDESKDGKLTYREKHKDGILYIDIFKKNTFITEVKTGASIYQKYRIKIISNKDILLNSSDVGSSVISEIKPEVWKCLDVAEYVLGDKKILVVFTGSIKAVGGGNIYDQITLICLGNKETFHLNLTGKFSRYERFLKIINQNTFSIYNGEKEFKFQVHNSAFVEI